MTIIGEGYSFSGCVLLWLRSGTVYVICSRLTPPPWLTASNNTAVGDQWQRAVIVSFYERTRTVPAILHLTLSAAQYSSPQNQLNDFVVSPYLSPALCNCSMSVRLRGRPKILLELQTSFGRIDTGSCLQACCFRSLPPSPGSSSPC